MPEKPKAIIIGGNYSQLQVREKTGEQLELGELLVAPPGKNAGLLLQVTNLEFGSQLSQQNRELLSGLSIEEGMELGLQDASLRTYTLGICKPVLTLPGMRAPKGLPAIFSELRALEASDLHFEKPANAIYVGNVRSGSRELPIPVFVHAKELLTHHVLVAATTGRGKSNLMKVLLQDLLDKDFASVLVFDPHAEYAQALSGQRLAVYAKDPAPGGYSLRVHLGVLRPHHFDGVYDWTDAQRETMRLYWKHFKEGWLQQLLLDSTPLPGVHEGTLAVLKRRLGLVLALDADQGSLHAKGIFDPHAGTTTMDDIIRRLTSGAVVIVETASLSDAAEILIASVITSEVYERWRRERPARVLSLCLEEAPRFIGEDALKSGPNVFSQIAREGRKFGVGLIAITQLPSLIPRTVLANMNTKIILGIEMAPERKAIIESSPQDLSADDRIIASLERGEAIITSTFTSFAIPVRIPLHKKPMRPTSAVPGLKSEVS